MVSHDQQNTFSMVLIYSNLWMQKNQKYANIPANNSVTSVKESLNVVDLYLYLNQPKTHNVLNIPAKHLN